MLNQFVVAVCGYLLSSYYFEMHKNSHHNHFRLKTFFVFFHCGTIVSAAEQETLLCPWCLKKYHDITIMVVSKNIGTLHVHLKI